MKIRKFSIKRALLVAMSAGIAFGFTGCGKKSDCEITKYHLHRYEKEGIVRYLPIEDLEYWGYQWTDTIEYEDESEKGLHEFEKKKGLIRIEDNIEYLKEQEECNTDYIEYRYSYIYLMPIPHVVKSGKTTITYFTYMPIIHHSWTSDPEHRRLTGETRVCHHMYVGYRVEKDEKGKLILIESPKVDSIFDIQEDYPYFKEDYTKIVGLSDHEELDYENSEDDDEENIVPEENEDEYEEGKEYKKK